MALLKPEIARTLREAGIGEPAEDDIKELFKNHRLSVDDSIGILADIAQNSGNDGLKLRAVDLALKAQQVMRDQGAMPTQVTFIINDPSSKGMTINPILIPRGM